MTREQHIEQIPLLVADDHAAVRLGLRVLLESAPEIRLVGEAENGRQAINMAMRLRPKVVVMDLAMPILNGAQATRELLRQMPLARVLALSTYADARSVRRMLQAGAVGYVLKQSAGDELLEAVRTVHRGEVYLSRKVEQILGEEGQMGRGEPLADEPGSRLSLPESEVLQLIAEGFSSKEISGELGLSIKEVRVLRRRLMKKLDLSNIAGLARYALSQNLVEGNQAEAL